jgi:hypothetical protein
MGIETYSTTAASNTALFPEGMTPSSVNDGMRAVQADIATFYQDVQFSKTNDTPTYVSATSFTVPGNLTSTYSVGRAIKCTDASTLYGVITASAYSTVTTVTVKLISGSLSASLTAISLGTITPTNSAMPATYGRKGNDIASASSVDLSAAGGDFVDVTGTTTITSIASEAAGVVRTVRFTGALTLTYNATSLILPGAANITTANGDTAIFRSLGSGNWVCIVYKKADGTAIVPSATAPFTDSTAIVKGSSDSTKQLRFEVDGFTTATTRVITPPDRDLTSNNFVYELISTATANSSSSISFTGLSSSYSVYILEIISLVAATNNVGLYLTISTDNGSTYVSANYSDVGMTCQGSAVGAAGHSSAAQFDLLEESTASNGTGEGVAGRLALYNIGVAERFKYIFNGGWYRNATGQKTVASSGVNNATSVNAIKIAMSSGNISTGTFKLYGLRAA